MGTGTGVGKWKGEEEIKGGKGGRGGERDGQQEMRRKGLGSGSERMGKVLERREGRRNRWMGDKGTKEERTAGAPGGSSPQKVPGWG